MRSFSARPLLIVFAALGLGGLILAGCDSNPTGAEENQSNPRVPPDNVTSSSIMADNGPQEASLSTSPVLTFGAMKDVGTSRLVRTDDAIATKTNTTELVHRQVTTLWWVVFNEPENCTDPGCGADDLFEPSDAKPSCPYADGSIVGGNGYARYQDRLTVGEDRNSCIEFLVENNAELEGEDHGLLNPEKAEVHVVVRSHGPLIPGMVPEMRSSFARGCTEFLPQGTVPEQQGQCADLQFAVHTPPE